MRKPIKRPYERPEVTRLEPKEISIYSTDTAIKASAMLAVRHGNPELRDRHMKLLAKCTRVAITKSGKKVYLRNVSKHELDIVKYLHNSGVNVEEPFRFEVPENGHHPMAFMDMGKSITQSVLEDPSNPHIFPAFFRELGKMHALGVEHGHPHFQNATYKDGKVYFIDFSLAKRKQIDWSDPANIFRAFREDYMCILYNHYEYFGEKRILALLEEIINNYPTTQKIKEELIKRMGSIIEQIL
ncbi:MAG: hypothetical protein PHH82_02415 [Candidatus ainarchaeum sp.]|nr:hypothetical protein [Candidatus ainarchaeum sp.]